MKEKGAIFDLDGTILASTWVWSGIDKDFLGGRGIAVPDDYAEKIISMSFEETARYTIERFSLKEKLEDVIAEWNHMAADAYAKKVKLKDGTKQLLEWLSAEGIKIGIATSNKAELFLPCLENNGISHYFHSYTETGDVTRGKEFPDVYIKEAEKLGLSPEECIVFEDIIPALKGAKSGGFATIGVEEEKWGYDREEFAKHCDYAITNLSQAIEFIKGKEEENAGI